MKAFTPPPKILKRNNNGGFTLAEVLITLVIIGIIASVTIPAVINDTKEKELVTQAKKAYSTFLNVLNRMKADQGSLDYGGIFTTSLSRDEKVQEIAKYYSGATVCTEPSEVCGTYYSIKMANGDNDGSPLSFPRILLPDGSLVYFWIVGTSCEPYSSAGHTFTRCATVIFDVNGEGKGPNQYGADLHQLIVNKDGVTIPEGNYSALKSILLYNKLNYTK